MLKRSDDQGVTPRIVATNTSWEYWRGDASLLRIDPLGPDGPRDLPEHPLVRHYHLSGTQHGSGALPQTDTFEIGEERGGHGFNVVDYSPLTRAALVHLDRWIADGTEPPPSAHPRIADGTGVSRAEVLKHFAASGPVTLDPERLSRVRTIDLGPDAAKGVGRYPSREGAEYPAYVSAIDADGNELAGVRLPDISSPVATHTGWNPRHETNGAPGLAAHFVGITNFWSAEEITRRYPTRDAYEQCVTADAQILVESARILPEDKSLAISNALARSHFVGISHFWSDEEITRRYPTRDAYEQCVTADAQILVDHPAGKSLDLAEHHNCAAEPQPRCACALGTALTIEHWSVIWAFAMIFKR